MINDEFKNLNLENKEKNNNIEEKKSFKKSYEKFIFKFFSIIFIILILYVCGVFFWNYYDKKQGEKKIENIAHQLKNLEAEALRLAEEDIYGGKTPYETLQMFIEAVEKGDYDLASKYFVIGKQEEWKEELQSIERVNKINDFINPLKKALNSKGEYSYNKESFSFHNPYIGFLKYTNKELWKITKI